MQLAADARRVLDLIRQAGRPPFEEMSYSEAREIYLRSPKALQSLPLPVAAIRDFKVDGADGKLAARLYRGIGTNSDAALPALIFFHGGGWVVGDLNTHDGMCRRLANVASCAVISIDYRLAPENTFPAAVNDAIAATAWIAVNAPELSVDSTRLAVGGDSAGGNLAAVVAIDACKSGGPCLVYQLLIYPAVDFCDNYEANRQRSAGMPLASTTMCWFRDLYLRGQSDYSDWRASPLRAANHAGLPPAYILTVGFDPLCVQGEQYVRCLRAAGVPVTHRHVADQFHDFITMDKFIGAAESECRIAGEALSAALKITCTATEELR